MKRLSFLATMGICVLTLTACGGKTKSENETVTVKNNSEKQSSTTEENVTVESIQEDENETEVSTEMFNVSDVETTELTSKDLHDGVWDTVITNTNAGSNVSPQLSWEEVEGADSYVIYMVDNSANSWLHWISKDVKETELEQGWADTKEYKGPYPPDGTHEYEIYVIALKNPVSEVYGTFDKGNMTFEKNKYNCDITDDGESGNILAVGTLTGTYTAGE